MRCLEKRSFRRFDSVLCLFRHNAVTMPDSPSLRPVVLIGSAKSDLRGFPGGVKDSIGFALYVAHAFQKKSKTGIETPKAEINLIKSRLKRAEEEHAAWLERRKGVDQHD